MVFVFGSNEAGRHGAGAASTAYSRHGAIYGKGVGRAGMSYAIPTKDAQLRILSLEDVGSYVQQFIAYATAHPNIDFQVTQIGCGLAGFTAEEIAPLFAGAPDNCLFDEAWETYLPPDAKFWGTF